MYDTKLIYDKKWDIVIRLDILPPKYLLVITDDSMNETTKYK